MQQRNISSSDRAAGVHLAAKQAQELQFIPMQAWRFHKVFAIKLRVQSNLTRQCMPKMNREAEKKNQFSSVCISFNT